MDILVDNLFIDQENTQQCQRIPGYLIRSTARANVEDLQDIKRDEGDPTIETVIDLLYEKSKKNNHNSNDMGVVIAVHGYNTGGADVKLNIKTDGIVDRVWKNWYQKLCQYVNNDPLISKKSDSLVFLGYRWPSENIAGKNLATSLSALPFLLKHLLWGGLAVSLISLLLFFLLSSPLLIVPMLLGTFGFALVFSLLILRVIVYFRDSYRATNYGVNDLVELIRQLDQGLIQRHIKEQRNKKSNDEELYNKAKHYWEQHPIKLSFIGHSMGAHVVTQAVRILSDVFDPRSVGIINNEKAGKIPSPRIGQVFCLGRLILVSPDIPVLTITSGRSNFLRSSLRRFEEAYLFSNEGDLALRLASTAANYFSFPAVSRTQGHRLGNVTVRRQNDKSNNSEKPPSKYGIINWKDKDLSKPLSEISDLLKYLEISVLNQKLNQGLDPASQEQQPCEGDGKKTVSGKVATAIKDRESIADLFTYFDCTEYKDLTTYDNAPEQDHYVMGVDKQTSPFTLWEYLKLGWAYFASASKEPFPFESGARDVHGGYFWGKFSQQLMYRLAFVGFQEYLDYLLEDSIKSSQDLRHNASSLKAVRDWLCVNDQLSPPTKRQIALAYLSWLMEQKQIQTVLSPERYCVDVMGEERTRVRKKILSKKVNR